MEIEKIKKEDLETLQSSSYFLFYLPRNWQIDNVTYRREGEKWSTLRFECEVRGKKVRAKVFFLDWFYQGFPKSLMESFIGSYSTVTSETDQDRVSFYGKNYKNKDACSSFALGTQIEIEGDSSDVVKELNKDLFPTYKTSRFEQFPFYRRSFLARGGEPDWFEERRISRMKWSPIKDMRVGERLKGDSHGVFSARGQVLEEINIFSEPYSRRVVWADVADKRGGEEYLFYTLRKEGMFFDKFEENNGILATRTDNGPSLYQQENSEKVVTISLSPMFSRIETIDVIERLLEKANGMKKYI